MCFVVCNFIFCNQDPSPPELQTLHHRVYTAARDVIDEIALAAAVKTAVVVKGAKDAHMESERAAITGAVVLPDSLDQNVVGFEEVGKNEMIKAQKSWTDHATITTATIGDSGPMDTDLPKPFTSPMSKHGSDDYVDDFDLSDTELWDKLKELDGKEREAVFKL